MQVIQTIFTASIVLLGFSAGAAIGSGGACFVQRRRHGESWVHGRSHCDSCGHTLGWKDLIPVVSYLTEKGKCRYCGAHIPPTCLYPELTCGAIGAMLAGIAVASVI